MVEVTRPAGELRLEVAVDGADLVVVVLDGRADDPGWHLQVEAGGRLPSITAVPAAPVTFADDTTYRPRIDLDRSGVRAPRGGGLGRTVVRLAAAAPLAPALTLT